MDINPTNVGELRKEFQQKKSALTRLRSQLYQIYKEKNDFFQQMKSGRDQLRSLTAQLKQLKKERDQLTDEVKELKQHRNELNTEVKEKFSVKKDAEDKKKKLLDSAGFKGDPAKIKQEINHLEEKIETEVMPFSQEQGLRKKIKVLQAVYKKLEQLGTAWKEVNTVTANFSQKRREAEDSHQQVQHKADESQSKHEEMNKIYAKIKEIRTQQNPLAEQHLAAKVKLEETKKELDELTKRVNELAKLLDEQEEESFNVKARKKTAEVKEKMRSGKKLSTEDILAFQALKD